MTNQILIVEDDTGLQKYLRELFLDSGFNTRIVGDGPEAISVVNEQEPDLVLLDIGLPSMSGDDVCREIKKTHPKLPIIMLTAREGTASVVNSFNQGADDYVTKPFVAEELLARIRSRLRPFGDGETKVTVGDLCLDPKMVKVERAGKEITLTPQEFKLLYYLMANTGRVLSRDMILNRVWMYSPDVESRVVDIYMGYLRKKIDKGKVKKLLKSVRGFGYKISDD
jgi:DNA-binding response OmpR family regulator